MRELEKEKEEPEKKEEEEEEIEGCEEIKMEGKPFKTTEEKFSSFLQDRMGKHEKIGKKTEKRRQES